jgi:glutamate--cysteine ligase
MAPFAAMLDTAYSGQRYQSALQALRQRIDQPESTPSAQVIEAVKKQGSYFNFAMDLSKAHTQSLQALALDPLTQEKFRDSVKTSLTEQARIDAQPQGSFDSYVAAYYA